MKQAIYFSPIKIQLNFPRKTVQNAIPDIKGNSFNCSPNTSETIVSVSTTQLRYKNQVKKKQLPTSEFSMYSAYMSNINAKVIETIFKSRLFNKQKENSTQKEVSAHLFAHSLYLGANSSSSYSGPGNSSSCIFRTGKQFILLTRGGGGSLFIISRKTVKMPN